MSCPLSVSTPSLARWNLTFVQAQLHFFHNLPKAEYTPQYVYVYVSNSGGDSRAAEPTKPRS